MHWHIVSGRPPSPFLLRTRLRIAYRLVDSQGVRITIDGVECPEKEWEKIFEMGEDGGFYMGDYVGAEQGCLKEIRFDKVYLSDPPKEKKDKDS